MTRVVVFGECMVELVNAEGGQFTKSFAGDTYNTAVYMKRCAPDSSVSYFTAIGADFLSDELLFRMGDEELYTDLVYRSHQHNLGLYMVRTDKRGERTFAYWRKDSAASQTMNLHKNNVLEASWFYFSGISIAILDDEQRYALFVLIKKLKQNGCKIVFDPNYRPRLWRDRNDAQLWTDKGYNVADVAFPGGDDHLALYDHVSMEDIHDHVSALGVNEIVIKNGAVGVHIFEGKQHCIVPVERVENVIDTTAAGDAFNGGYLASRLCGKNVTDAASYGAKVASTVISYPGAIVKKETFTAEVPTLR